MYCKYLSKCLNGSLRCKLLKTITYIDNCKKCLKFEPRVNKPIKKVSNKRITVTEETYNKVMQRDKYKCRLCGTSLNLHLHHIDGRGKDLTNNVDNCIILCENCHLNVVHKNQKKYRPILKKIIENTKEIGWLQRLL